MKIEKHTFLSQGKFNTRVYNKRDDLFFPIVNFSLGWWWSFGLMGRLYFSVCSFCTRLCICINVSDFNYHNLVIADKLSHQGYRFHKLLKTATKVHYNYIMILYINTILHAEILSKGRFPIHMYMATKLSKLQTSTFTHSNL